MSLWRDISERANSMVIPRPASKWPFLVAETLDFEREAKVGNQRMTVLGQQDVGRLEIAMYEP